MGNPSIAPTRKGKKDVEKEKHSLKQLSKHRFKSHNTVTVAGKGKPMIGNGWEAAVETKWAREIRPRLRCTGEPLTPFLRKHLVCHLNRGYFKERIKEKFFRTDSVLTVGERYDRI